jgi:hypothetical protein
MKEIELILELMLLVEKLSSEGYAINGSGVAINMDEIKKCENMYTGDNIGVFDD